MSQDTLDLHGTLGLYTISTAGTSWDVLRCPIKVVWWKGQSVAVLYHPVFQTPKQVFNSLPGELSLLES